MELFQAYYNVDNYKIVQMSKRSLMIITHLRVQSENLRLNLIQVQILGYLNYLTLQVQF